METTQEKIFFQDARVIVTQSRFVADGKTYAMRNISSVSIFQISKSRVAPVIMGLIGLLCFLGSSTAILFGVILIATSLLWWFSIKDEYSVRINSNSGESNGFISTDREHIQKIVEAVNDAIIFRG